jgi:hypothetical protein
MSKKHWIIMAVFFAITTSISAGFAKYYASNFPVPSGCDKYLELMNNSTGITQHNALSDYNSCSAKEMVKNVDVGINKSKAFLYLNLVSFGLLIFSLINLLLKSKVNEK